MKRDDVLLDWLNGQTADRVDLMFEDIEDEDRIGKKLPRAARERRTWWTNQFRPNPRISRSADRIVTQWKVKDVDLRRERVTFVRIRT